MFILLCTSLTFFFPTLHFMVINFSAYFILFLVSVVFINANAHIFILFIYLNYNDFSPFSFSSLHFKLINFAGNDLFSIQFQGDNISSFTVYSVTHITNFFFRFQHAFYGNSFFNFFGGILFLVSIIFIDVDAHTFILFI